MIWADTVNDKAADCRHPQKAQEEPNILTHAICPEGSRQSGQNLVQKTTRGPNWETRSTSELPLGIHIRKPNSLLGQARKAKWAGLPATDVALRLDCWAGSALLGKQGGFTVWQRPFLERPIAPMGGGRNLDRAQEPNLKVGLARPETLQIPPSEQNANRLGTRRGVGEQTCNVQVFLALARSASPTPTTVSCALLMDSASLVKHAAYWAARRGKGQVL